MTENLENSAVATGLERVSFHSNPKNGNAKECSNYCLAGCRPWGCTESDITEVTEHAGINSKYRGPEAKRTWCVQEAAQG